MVVHRFGNNAINRTRSNLLDNRIEASPLILSAASADTTTVPPSADFATTYSLPNPIVEIGGNPTVTAPVLDIAT